MMLHGYSLSDNAGVYCTEKSHEKVLPCINTRQIAAEAISQDYYSAMTRLISVVSVDRTFNVATCWCIYFVVRMGLMPL